ncbi:biotin/lipoyl-containing protein [Celerinatantimonas sp. MCCC 1A17872]|uniref:biotin/lipoyl-containing protein n=1 Tax=Celerinatantimonas sp. MCCC 1A17872 TaxID=3177514 RepID=UPI0038C9F774
MTSKAITIHAPKLPEIAKAKIVQWLITPGQNLIKGNDYIEIEIIHSKQRIALKSPINGILQIAVAALDDAIHAGSLIAIAEMFEEK